MSTGPDLRRGLKRSADALARQVPVDAHKGDRWDFLRRHERAAREAARGTRRQRKKFAAGLHRRVADTRNLLCAMDHLVRHGGKAPGPNGLRLEDLSPQERGELARTIRGAINSGRYRPGPTRKVKVPKASGRGTRTLDIANVEDRVVQRAIAQIVQPLMDTNFDRHSLGFRPDLGREHALALAEFRAEGHAVWIAQDLRDAFTQVPHGRLLDLLRQHHGLAAETVELIGRVIGAGRARGIPQGSPISPLLLNAYADRHLDRAWRERSDLTMIRVADDLLILCRTRGMARAAHGLLAQLTTAAGLPLKHEAREATCEVGAGQPVDWLGYRIHRDGSELVVRAGPKSHNSLAQHLEATHADPWAPVVANWVITGWFDQMGPCWPYERAEEVHDRVGTVAQRLAFDETPPLEEAQERWQRAYARYTAIKRAVALGDGGLASGSARRHRNSARLGRGGGTPDQGVPSPTFADTPEVTIYVDGSCLGNRIGGWAYLVVGPGTNERRYQADSHPRATNNRMELLAAIRGLESLEGPCQVTLVTDSKYVADGVVEWLPRWKANKWRRNGRGSGTIRNLRLWQRLDDLIRQHDVTVEWVHGHAGHPENEEVDRLARQAAVEH